MKNPFSRHFIFIQKSFFFCAVWLTGGFNCIKNVISGRNGYEAMTDAEIASKRAIEI